MLTIWGPMRTQMGSAPPIPYLILLHTFWMAGLYAREIQALIPKGPKRPLQPYYYPSNLLQDINCQFQRQWWLPCRNSWLRSVSLHPHRHLTNAEPNYKILSSSMWCQSSTFWTPDVSNGSLSFHYSRDSVPHEAVLAVTKPFGPFYLIESDEQLPEPWNICQIQFMKGLQNLNILISLHERADLTFNWIAYHQCKSYIFKRTKYFCLRAKSSREAITTTLSQPSSCVTPDLSTNCSLFPTSSICSSKSTLFLCSTLEYQALKVTSISQCSS